MNQRLLPAALLAACTVAFAGCGDSGKLGEATSYNRDTKGYSGKLDTRPYENAPSFYSNGSSWTANDKTSWEGAIKQRQQKQNEYSRAE